MCVIFVLDLMRMNEVSERGIINTILTYLLYSQTKQLDSSSLAHGFFLCGAQFCGVRLLCHDRPPYFTVYIVRVMALLLNTPPTYMNELSNNTNYIKL